LGGADDVVRVVEAGVVQQSLGHPEDLLQRAPEHRAHLAGQLVGQARATDLQYTQGFLTGAVSIVLLTVGAPIGVLLLFVAIVGLGTSGTQTLLFGFVANYFRTNVRGAAVAWCAGFGRLGGVGGPLLGGLLVAAGLALNSIFYILASVALLGAILTLLVPARRTHDLHPTPIEPSTAAAAPVAQTERVNPTA